MGLWQAGFFFSSRRRHTRLQGDWSSDVCSSDLGRNDFPRAPSVGLIGEPISIRSPSLVSEALPPLSGDEKECWTRCFFALGFPNHDLFKYLIILPVIT